MRVELLFGVAQLYFPNGPFGKFWGFYGIACTEETRLHNDAGQNRRPISCSVEIQYRFYVIVGKLARGRFGSITAINSARAN